MAGTWHLQLLYWVMWSYWQKRYYHPEDLWSRVCELQLQIIITPTTDYIISIAHTIVGKDTRHTHTHTTHQVYYFATDMMLTCLRSPPSQYSIHKNGKLNALPNSRSSACRAVVMLGWASLDSRFISLYHLSSMPRSMCVGIRHSLIARWAPSCYIIMIANPY